MTVVWSHHMQITYWIIVQPQPGCDLLAKKSNSVHFFSINILQFFYDLQVPLPTKQKKNPPKMLSSKSFKKTRTFQLQNSPPAPPSKPQRSATFNYNNNNNGTRKSPLREFPTSPQLISGAQFIHFGHPQHALSEIDLPDLFTCAGCKEYGSGKRFTCQQCDFQLHEFCAYAPKAPQTHPLHRQHQLLFFSKPG